MNETLRSFYKAEQEQNHYDRNVSEDERDDKVALIHKLKSHEANDFTWSDSWTDGQEKCCYCWLFNTVERRKEIAINGNL